MASLVLPAVNYGASDSLCLEDFQAQRLQGLIEIPVRQAQAALSLYALFLRLTCLPALAHTNTHANERPHQMPYYSISSRFALAKIIVANCRFQKIGKKWFLRLIGLSLQPPTLRAGWAQAQSGNPMLMADACMKSLRFSVRS